MASAESSFFGRGVRVFFFFFFFWGGGGVEFFFGGFVGQRRRLLLKKGLKNRNKNKTESMFGIMMDDSALVLLVLFNFFQGTSMIQYFFLGSDSIFEPRYQLRSTYRYNHKFW